jgi:hypothetical protein
MRPVAHHSISIARRDTYLPHLFSAPSNDTRGGAVGSAARWADHGAAAAALDRRRWCQGVRRCWCGYIERARAAEVLHEAHRSGSPLRVPLVDPDDFQGPAGLAKLRSNRRISRGNVLN